jgi:N-acetylmuramoyl-L-alanine amidase CwlA
MDIEEKFLTLGSAHGRPGTALAAKGIVIHYVGNPGSSALANRNWFEGGAGGARTSAHYIIGLKGEILLCVPESEKAVHAGKSYGAKWDAIAPKANSSYIGIECCHPDASGKFNEATTASLVWLASDICRRRGLDPGKDVFRHYDVAGKACPLYYVNNPDAWIALAGEIKKALQPPAGGGTPIAGPPSVTAAQMSAWAATKGAAPWFRENAQTFHDAALAAGIDPAAAYAQSAKETGLGRFGGVLDESFHNPCGLKTSSPKDDSPESHMRFASWKEGIQAQADHLALYAGAPGFPKAGTPDPRHFPSIKGTAKTVEELGGKWAPSLEYGKEVSKIMSEIQAQKAPEASAPPKAQAPSGLAAEAWEWAVKQEILDGTRPQDFATREMIACMLQRALAVTKQD